MPIIKLSATERRRVSAFFTCLVLAVCAWIFSVLSNTYNYTVKEALNFKNTPQRRAFHSLQSDTVNVTVSGSGWEMLFSRMNNRVKVFTVDLNSLENKSYIVLSTQLDQINNKREIGQQITGFIPDTLYFDFSNRKVKRVPVKLITSIRYNKQFSQSDNITIKPGYVIVNGPASVIDKLTEWPSDTLRADSVGETLNTELGLQPVKEGNLSIYPKTVRINVPVDEFTEKTLLVPVKLINNYNYDDVKIFPQKVKITFMVSLSRYAETDEDFFEATANLDLWRNQGYKVLPVIVSKIPWFCKLVKVEPQNIDFIVRK
jgi:YbbR domain-containing protein